MTLAICRLRYTIQALTFIIFICLTGTLAAQQYKCGAAAILLKKPELKLVIEDQPTPSQKTTQPASTDHSQRYAIPVVFHILLTDKQIAQIGGEEGIRSRIDSQMKIINEDFNRENADSTLIPAPFKPFYGNGNIRFALARTTPAGAPTEGYQIKTVKTNGFELYDNFGSGVGFTGSKYVAAGGLDAWDPTAYINIWVLYPVENGAPSRLAGLTIPPSYVGARYGIPLEEQGITLHYGAFGKRRSVGEYYVAGATLGRTLTHELGHFFNLRHVWGDDDGACPGQPGGEDDGIADTPPQGRETYGDPRFPLFDSCTTTGNGIMFMNFMDYTNDRSKYMFTTEQVARMQREVAADGISYSLTKQPHLLEYGTAIKNNVFFYPNPANEYLQLFVETIPSELEGVTIHNSFGQLMYTMNKPEKPLSYYKLNTSNLASGMYYITFHFKDLSEVKKLQIIH